MENVIAFNNELSGLYESKPPISKAKMAAITKAAMRAIKFYKHVVQSVEKFILKCKPEYKVPGLYVIDSIVRQSRHQFGVEKDVFAPRFARNMKDTFANLFRCAPDDKSRIIRVLNLWQKNNVFAPDVIQPIFDLADPNHPIYQMPPQQSSSGLDVSATSNGLNTSSAGMDTSGVGAMAGNQSAVDDKLVLPDLSNNNLKQLLKDPNVLRQLQTLQNFQKFKQQEEKQQKLNELRMQEEAFEKHIQNVLKGSTSNEAADMSSKEVEFVSEESKIEVINLDGNDSRSPSPDQNRYKRRRSRSRSRDRAQGRDLRRRRSRSRSSRSRSPRSNRRRPSRERDRERDRLADRNRDKEKEKEREHERERRRKGLPDIKKEHLSVCSTTLWVGHLSKLVYQEELSDTFGKYGDIVSIDQIVPRGCAFIVMNRRQDATKAMNSLKNYKLQGRAITISWAAGKGVKSKEWKDFWDLELGVTYIPWDKLEKDTDLDALEEGGIIDEDSMPDWMKEKLNKMKNVKEPAAVVAADGGGTAMMFGVEGLPKIDVTQPPPQAGAMMPMPPFTMAPPMGGPPRMMPPMGVPMPGNMVSGIPMPQAMVAGMPPPHPMMMAAGMLPPPGFPPMPLDKNIPPPNLRPDAGMPPNPFMGNPGMMQPMQIPTQHPFQPNTGGNASSDDQMDIEMEDEMSNDNSQHGGPPMSFNQPPPMFQGGGAGQGLGPGPVPGPVPGPGLGSSLGPGQGPGGFPEGGMPPGNDGGEDYGRDRNRGNNSRWGSRDDRDQNSNRGNRGGDQSDGDMWRENGPPMGGLPNFNDSSRRGGPGNMPPFDMNNHPQRQEFFDMRHGGGTDDFNDRRGGGSGRGGGDFYPNMQNRFNQPNSLMQMRIQPPAAFNNRMNGPGMGPGPGMFMRGQGPRSQGGPQGGGFGFNDRNPFDREMDGGNRMRGGRGMNDRRGGGGRGGGGRGGQNNWRDNDEDDDGGAFNRRGNRFRDGPDDNRMSRDRDRMGGRRQMNDRNSRDRFDRTSRERREGGSNDRNPRNRKMSSENRDSSPPKPGMHKEPQAANVKLDTEEDWDQELSEHDLDNSTKSNENTREDQEPQNEQNETNNTSEAGHANESEPHYQQDEEFTAPPQTPKEEQPPKQIERMNSVNTPLYDEPAPAFESKSTSSDNYAESDNVPECKEIDTAPPEPTPTPTTEPSVEAEAATVAVQQAEE